MIAPFTVYAANVVLVLALAICVVTDLRSRHIYDVVTLSALGVGIGLHFLGGWLELQSSLLGTTVAAAPFLAAFFFGWMADGDVKLMAAAGALKGWPFALGLLLAVSIAGGLQGILWIAAARLRKKPAPKHLPYGVAIATGALVSLLVEYNVV